MKHFIPALLFSLVSPALAQNIPEEMKRNCAGNGIPGMGVVIFSDTEILSHHVSGVRKRGTDVAVTIDDKWHLGSITKSMTASVAGMLVEEGKVRWTTTLGDTFPEIHADYRPVTLEELLAHRGGMSHDGVQEIWVAFTRQKGSPAETRKWWIDQLLTVPPQQKPGEFVYSNPGIVAAARILESSTGKDWETLMQEKLFRPLGLKSAGFGFTASVGKVDQPWGHNASSTPVLPGPKADNPPGLGPAGTVHMSLRDLATYGQWHLTNGRTHPKVLSEKMMQRLHEPRHKEANGSTYECGWTMVNRPWAGGRALTHSGSNNMNFAILWLAPKKNFGFAVTLNRGGDEASKAAEQMAAYIVVKARKE